MSAHSPLVTILINNFNYGRFLPEAIESALKQTYQNLEVIVVDDGSTDDSRDVISAYGNRIIPVLKENGGQASAFNAGVVVSRGDIICLLDSDDTFFPNKVERLVPYSEARSIIHHRMQLDPGPGSIPSKPIGTLDAYRYARHYGYFPFLGSPTSGIVIRRDLALQLFPIPHVSTCADDFIVRGAALLGNVVWIPDILGTYRIHGENLWYTKRPVKSLEYMRQIENYLNEKLIGVGKLPIIDFYNGMYGLDYIAQDPSEYVRLAMAVLVKHPSLLSLRFALNTIRRAYSLARGF
jgi:glycosyltransferase involved in cell wall biosynthesis